MSEEHHNNLRIAIGSMSNETSHFLTTISELEHWQNNYVLYEDDLFQLAGTDCEISGMLTAFETQDVDLVPLMAANGVAGGPNSDSCYQHLKESILNPLRQAMPLDGIALALHGSMTAVSEDDVEGDLLVSVREIVGSDVSIIVTLDLHAHITEKMIKNADGIIGYTHYPHDDAFSTGERGADLLLRIIRGEVTPKMAMAKVPILSSGVRGMTFGDAPMAKLTSRARQLEADPDILSVSIFHCHPTNDVPGMGSGGLVITNNDSKRAIDEARVLAEEYWSLRYEFEPDIISIDEAVKRGRNIDGGPILLIDTSDCVGGGGAGDSVALLKRLLELDITEPTLVMIVDPDVAQRCAEAGIGGHVHCNLGYKIDSSWGQPIEVEGVVQHLLDGDFIYTGGVFGGTKTSMGLSAVLAIGNIQVLIMSKPTYDWADEQYRTAGLDVDRAKFIGVKNPMNYHFAYKDAKADFILDTLGVTPPTVKHLTYKRMERPFFPKDEDIPDLKPTVFSTDQ
jgi:microcystin degradation protein MlrC